MRLGPGPGHAPMGGGHSKDGGQPLRVREGTLTAGSPHRRTRLPETGVTVTLPHTRTPRGPFASRGPRAPAGRAEARVTGRPARTSDFAAPRAEPDADAWGQWPRRRTRARTPTPRGTWWQARRASGTRAPCAEGGRKRSRGETGLTARAEGPRPGLRGRPAHGPARSCPARHSHSRPRRRLSGRRRRHFPPARQVGRPSLRGWQSAPKKSAEVRIRATRVPRVHDPLRTHARLSRTDRVLDGP